MGGLLSCAAAQLICQVRVPWLVHIGTNQLYCQLAESAAAAASSVSRSYLPVAALAFYCASGVAAAQRVTTGTRPGRPGPGLDGRIRELLAAQARRARGRGSNLNLKLGCMSLWPEAATTSPGHRALPQAAVDCHASALRLPTGRQGDVCFSAEIRAECHSGWYANDARVLTDRASALRRDSGDAVDASDMY